MIARTRFGSGGKTLPVRGSSYILEMQTNVLLSKREGGRATLYVPMNAVRDGRIPPLHPGSAMTVNGVHLLVRRRGKTVIRRQGFLRTPVRAYQVEIVRGAAR